MNCGANLKQNKGKWGGGELLTTVIEFVLAFLAIFLVIANRRLRDAFALRALKCPRRTWHV